MNTKTWSKTDGELRRKILAEAVKGEKPAVYAWTMLYWRNEWRTMPRRLRVAVNKSLGETTKRTQKTFEVMRDTQFDIGAQNDQRFGGTLDETGE